MQQQSIDVAREAMEKHTIEKDIAQAIKKEFDSRFGATWHCIVGRNFGSFVTHGEWFYIPDAISFLKREERPCLLGGSLRSFPADQYVVAAETKHFIYFYMGHCAILLFKTQ